MRAERDAGPQAAGAVHHRRAARAGRTPCGRRPPTAPTRSRSGIPFSDPVMDGPVIQQASQAALDGGATPVSILDEVPRSRRRRPAGGDDVLQHRPPRRTRSASPSSSRAAGICAAHRARPAARGVRAVVRRGRRTPAIETVMLAAPTAPDERLPRIVARARGFVYSVGLLGVTGERDALAATATALAARLKAITDVPVLVGVGVSNAAQAHEAVPGRRRRGPGGLGGAPDDRERPRRGRRLRRRGPRRDRRAEPTELDRTGNACPVGVPRPGGVRAVRGGADHRVVLRGRDVLGRRVRDVLGADGRLEATTIPPRRPRSRRCSPNGWRWSSPASSTSSTSSTTTCARSRPTTTHMPGLAGSGAPAAGS